jgi:hypothetical protein
MGGYCSAPQESKVPPHWATVLRAFPKEGTVVLDEAYFAEVKVVQPWALDSRKATVWCTVRLPVGTTVHRGKDFAVASQAIVVSVLAKPLPKNMRGPFPDGRRITGPIRHRAGSYPSGGIFILSIQSESLTRFPPGQDIRPPALPLTPEERTEIIRNHMPVWPTLTPVRPTICIEQAPRIQIEQAPRRM